MVMSFPILAISFSSYVPYTRKKIEFDFAAEHNEWTQRLSESINNREVIE